MLDLVVTKISMKSTTKIACHYSQQMASSGVQWRGFVRDKVHLLRLLCVAKKVKVKQSRYRPGGAQRVLGS